MTAISFQESATLPAPRRIFCRRRQRAQARAAAHLLLCVGAVLLASLSL
jgi:hypothetical protein